MSDWTPSTVTVREVFAECMAAFHGQTKRQAFDSFDRWLTEVQADAWLEGAKDIGEPEWGPREWDDSNPYRKVNSD